MKDAAFTGENSCLTQVIENWVFEGWHKRNPICLQTIAEELFHVRTVASLMALLAPGRGLDPQIAEIIGLLHDAGRLRPNGSLVHHAETGAVSVAAFLNENKLLPKELHSCVVSAVRHHSSKGKDHGPYDELLKDADVFHRFLEGDPVLLKPSWGLRASKVIDELKSLTLKNAGHPLMLSSKDGTIRQGYLRAVSQASAWVALHQDRMLDQVLVHDIRVYIRQIKAIQYLFKPLIKAKDYRRIQNHLTEVLHIFETAREHAVELEALKVYTSQLIPQSNKGGSQGEKDDKHLNWAAARKVYLEQWAGDNALRELGNGWIKPLEECFLVMKKAKLKKASAKAPLDVFVMKRLHRLMDRWLSDFGRCDFEDEGSVHRSRIAVKKIRYVLRASSGLVEQEPHALLKVLEAYQTLAGALHDVAVSKALMDKAGKEMATGFAGALSDLDDAQEAYLAFRNLQGDDLREALAEVHSHLAAEISKYLSEGCKQK
ncbi:CHAD domain-containing protein [Acidaminobacter hydrogenoformans]|uniref:HD domain-containing protein n=1 Tax=Acidaminobacter hydrogenoformans DSM 2784 TaxID=1120920 RepID=A0A1G5S4B7_9FIRM|nr:CHAD domain-containing protein [Acidaminobacter hydrogenoformans]SCZ81204.1 HD domain-containing protein [Acidaminobacter hydrogenoformans DSM 2784]